MEEIKFNSIDELYNRLKPAFRTNITDLRKKNISFVEIKDIWNFLTKTKWSTRHDLELFDMVNDILNVDEVLLINYINAKR